MRQQSVASSCCCAHLQKGALSTAEVCEALGLSQMKGRRWHVQGAVAIRGEGLYEGLDWWVALPPCLSKGVPDTTALVMECVSLQVVQHAGKHAKTRAAHQRGGCQPLKQWTCSEEVASI